MREELMQNVAVKGVEDHDSRENSDGICIKLYESATPTINGAVTAVLRDYGYFIDELYHREDSEIYELYAYQKEELAESVNVPSIR